MLAYTFYENDNRVRRYAETLVRRGDRVDAIVLKKPGQSGYEVIQGVHVHRVQQRRIDEKSPFSYLLKLLIFFFRSAWVLARRHLALPYHLVHVHSVPDFEVFATVVPRLLGARVILDIHDIVPEFYASKFDIGERSPVFRLLVFIEKLSSAYANHVIISNHLWYKTLTRRSVRPEKCTAIINYPDPAIFYRRPRTASRGGDFVMYYPGTLNWHQGLDLAVKALAKLQHSVPNLRLVITGDGPGREFLKSMVEQECLQDRVTIRGFVPIDQVAETMANVDLGVVPKRGNSFGNEAFSTKIPEFMAMGVPVVAARTRVDEFYFNGDMLQFFEPGSVDDLAAKILDLVRDPSKRGTLTRNADEFVRQNNWDVKKSEYLALVEQLVGKSEHEYSHRFGAVAAHSGSNAPSAALTGTEPSGDQAGATAPDHGKSSSPPNSVRDGRGSL